MSGGTKFSRRRVLQLSAAAALGAAAVPAHLRGSVVAAAARLPAGELSASAGSRVLFRNVAIADGRTSRRQLGMSILVRDGRVAWIRPSDSEPDAGPRAGLEIVDAAGLTAVPGMVDAHCHLTSPGGANYIQRFLDAPAKLAEYAERNGQLARRAGTAWLRDVGAPTVVDPVDGRRRALSIGIAGRWQGRRDRPRVVAAGTWIAAPKVMTKGLPIVVRNGTELLAAAHRQLDQGARLIKLYAEAAGTKGSPWTAAQIRRVVDAAHARGATVTAHAAYLPATRTAVLGGVDAIEHGYRLDASLCDEMRRRGTYLITTLVVPRAWLEIGRTTSGTYWSTRAGRRYANRLLARATESARVAHRAGVKMCAGTDMGGGGTPAGRLAWEVESLVAAGLKPWQALAAATWRGGELLGDASAGRLREGGPADFFLVDGDPLSDPAALWRVARLA